MECYQVHYITQMFKLPGWEKVTYPTDHVQAIRLAKSQELNDDNCGTGTPGEATICLTDEGIERGNLHYTFREDVGTSAYFDGAQIRGRICDRGEKHTVERVK